MKLRGHTRAHTHPHTHTHTHTHTQYKCTYPTKIWSTTPHVCTDLNNRADTLCNMLVFWDKSLKQKSILKRTNTLKGFTYSHGESKLNKASACLPSWVCSAPENCTIMVHSFTNSSLELYYFFTQHLFFALWVCVCVCVCVCMWVCVCASGYLCVCVHPFQSKGNTGKYGAPSPKHCVTTSQQDEQILLSHLWTLGKSVHPGNVCTVLVSELRKEYAMSLESTAVLKNRKNKLNWNISSVLCVC